MKIGRAFADAVEQVPGMAPLIRKMQSQTRASRSRRRLRSMQQSHADADRPVATVEELVGMSASPAEYAAWIVTQEVPRDWQAKRLRSGHTSSTSAPLVSVLIPVYRVKTRFLIRTLESLAAQTCIDWEACVVCAAPDDLENRRLLEEWAACDPRFRVAFLDSNGGISANSNAALSMARGEFVALLDHDDELAPFALERMSEAIAADPEADFLYSDKDSIDEDSTLRQNALFKPEWSPEILFSVNYLTHFNLMRRNIVDEIGGFRSETDGAQDWDIFLRACSKSRHVVRVPGVHYHWRIHAASTSTGIAAKPYALDGQHTALLDHAARLGLRADIVRNDDSGFHVQGPAPATGMHVVIDGTGSDAGHLADLARTAAAIAADTTGDSPVRGGSTITDASASRAASALLTDSCCLIKEKN